MVIFEFFYIKNRTTYYTLVFGFEPIYPKQFFVKYRYFIFRLKIKNLQYVVINKHSQEVYTWACLLGSRINLPEQNLVCVCVCMYVRHAKKIASSVRSTQFPFKLNILYAQFFGQVTQFFAHILVFHKQVIG